MGSALGCVSNGKEGGANTNNSKAATDTATKGGKADELQGKSRYLGDIGAAIHVIEDKKIAIGHFLVFVDVDGKITFSCHITSKDKLYVAAFTDEEFQAKKEASQITLSFNAIFKSIVTETAKGKVKVAVQDASVSAQFNISSVKDAKTTQILPITLDLAVDPKAIAKNKYLLEPFSRMIAKKRTNVDDKEKEIKVSRMQMHSLISAASVSTSRHTIERIQKVIVPLREEAAQHSKQTNELVAKVEQLERRIRKLKHRYTTTKHPLDAMYDEGGARSFVHLPDSEEHIPTIREMNDQQLDLIKHKFPIATGAELATISATPSDPVYAKLMKDPQIANTMKHLERLDSWDMSVFDIERDTNGNALYVVCYSILQKMDLVNHFNIDDKILRNFLMNVQAGYHPNLYHNKTHAADVCQVNYYIMNKGGLIDKLKLTKEDLLAGILAGAIHDYDHPGFNNNFHTRSNAYLSTLYNDRSILENHHLACVFEMMRLPQFDIFKSLSDEQRRTVRETMIEMVLATDMGNHAAIFSSFRRRTAEGQDWHERREDIHLALSMSIKMADVSNCGRPNHLYIEWAKNISGEFYVQGDAEERRGLSISPFMDRKKDKTDFPKGQISFMNYVVVPMFEAIAEFLPPVECALQCCTENKEYWQHME